MKSFWQSVSNIREYVSHNPPGTTFFLCLLTLAISFIYLSSYSYTHSLPNPDIAKDWNIVLSSLTQFHLCEKINASSFEQVPPPLPLLMEQEQTPTTSVNSTEITSSVTVLQLRVPMTVTTSSQSASLKNIGLVSNLLASQLHLGGKEMINFTLQILSDNSNCLTISAPTNILPTSRLPPKCSTLEKNISIIPVEMTNQLETSHTCYKLHFHNDPTLTVMLTWKDKTVAVRHLLEVSVVLLGVCLLLCLAASLTNTRHKHHSGLDLQNEPLIDR